MELDSELRSFEFVVAFAAGLVPDEPSPSLENALVRFELEYPF